MIKTKVKKKLISFGNHEKKIISTAQKNAEMGRGKS